MGPGEMILPICSLILFPWAHVVTNIPKAILANYWRRRISVCLQRGVANAINTRTNKLTARTLDTGSSSQGECFFPGLVEEQSEAYRDGSLIACGEDEDSWGCGTMSAWGWGTTGAWRGKGQWILLTVENSKLKDKGKRTAVSGLHFVWSRETKTSHFSISFFTYIIHCTHIFIRRLKFTYVHKYHFYNISWTPVSKPVPLRMLD